MKNNTIKIILKGEEVLNMELDKGFKELTFTSNKEEFRIKIEKLKK